MSIRGAAVVRAVPPTAAPPAAAPPLAHQRSIALERDGHICQVCGLDCDALRRSYYDALSVAHGAHQARLRGAVTEVQRIASSLKLQGDLRTIRQRLRSLGFSTSRAFAEVDHIKPLALGGRNVLSNLRCVCQPCHKRLTNELRAQLRRRPSKRVMIVGENRQGKVAIV